MIAASDLRTALADAERHEDARAMAGIIGESTGLGDWLPTSAQVDAARFATTREQIDAQRLNVVLNELEAECEALRALVRAEWAGLPMLDDAVPAFAEALEHAARKITERGLA